MDAFVDPLVKGQNDVAAMRRAIDSALDRRADHTTLRTYAELLKRRKEQLAQLEACVDAAEINRQIFKIP